MQYDVVIVGAGPAGATAAKFLSEKGTRTLLLDKTLFPRDKPCGGGLPIRALKRFNYLEENDLIDSYSYGMHVYSTTLKHHIELEKNEPLVAMVLRKTFDQGLANLATREGAELRCGKAVQDIKIDADKAQVLLSDGSTIESQLVIGADGIWSTIAKMIGVHQDYKNIGVCVFNEYPMKPETLDHLYGDQRITHVHLQPHGLAGYGWVFPKKEHVNIGVVEFRQAIDPSKEKKNLKETFRKYLGILKDQKLIQKNLSAKTAWGGAFPTSVVDKLASDRVMLCGDAGGLVNPADGEGIYFAMCSGEIAANVAVKALENNTTDASALSPYQKQWGQEFQKNISLLHRLSKRWGGNIDNIVKLISKDKQLVDFVYAAMTNEGGAQKEKWKIARRFAITYCKDRLGLL